MILSAIEIFLKHRVAAHLLMAIFILAGVWGIKQLNVQFLPDFELDIIRIEVIWTGASAEDVARSITIPLSQSMRTLEGLRDLKANSMRGRSLILLEFKEGTDMSRAQDLVDEAIGRVRDLPEDAEKPQIIQMQHYDPVARLLVVGNNLQQMRPWIYQIERDLLNAGIAKINITGLPEEVIKIEIPSQTLARLNTSINEIASRIKENSQDLPAGTLGRKAVAKQLRSLSQKRDVQGFVHLPVFTDANGRVVRVGDIAHVRRIPRDQSVTLTYQGKPAVELRLLRDKGANTLVAAKTLHQWRKEKVPELPHGLQVITYDESWQLVKQRIMLLVRNGITGLILVLIMLFAFLNARVAFWVAMGIPISFMAGFAFLYLAGGSINMVSLFAMIMMLGVVVDDAIVVGEESARLAYIGHSAETAAHAGAKTMIAPVISAQLTTMSAFLPLMLIGGVMGNILFDIPLVVICVLLGSLLESFLILPFHLKHALSNFSRKKVTTGDLSSSSCGLVAGSGEFSARELLRKKDGFRRAFDKKFVYFKNHIFKKIVVKAIRYQSISLTVSFVVLLSIVGLLLSGRVLFTFFPSPDVSVINANVSFSAGTNSQEVSAFLEQLREALIQVEQKSGEKFVKHIIFFHKKTLAEDEAEVETGDNVGAIKVELTEPDERELRNQEVIDAWRRRLVLPPGIEKLSISAPRAGPPGHDIDIQLTGREPLQVKQAALILAQKLKGYQGVSNIKDDFPFGQKQWIIDLTPQGRMMGLTIRDLAQQLFAAYTGQLVQIFHETDEEIEVRVALPDKERYLVRSLRELPIITPEKTFVPFHSVATISEKPGQDHLRHNQNGLVVRVSADVDRQLNNANKILADLQSNGLNEVARTYHVQYSFEGLSKEQRETLGDMQQGMLYAFILIYLILAWVFSSFGWPLLVLLAVPFGLAGGIFGHYLLGRDLTILSLFGLFGLSGVVINDSIILVMTYRRKKEAGMRPLRGIIESSTQRLRPVLLTSLTTIAGLTPLLFERSLQAQFLIPMAISISFGLMFSTVLVLILIPVLLSLYELRHHKIARVKS